MDKNQGYSILKMIMLENGRGFALGENPRAPQPFVTWACYDDERGVRQYEWGHYGSDRAALEQDLSERVREYQRLYHVGVEHTEAPGLYKYYSTQRPVDIGTFPKPSHNAPDEIVNYPGRVWVEHDTRLAWGHLTYTRPLSEREMVDYELLPSRDNPDLKQRMEEQTQAVGAWEDARRIPDGKRLTWFCPDFGSYALKEYVSPEKLAEAALSMEIRKAISADMRRAGKPISEQMKDAQKLAGEQRAQPGPDKNAPDREDR